MLYKIEMDRDCFDKKKCFIKNNTLVCREHGNMSCVSVFEGKKGEFRKKIYRCLVCNIGIVYDGNLKDTQKEFLE